jgi:hypothetical protein
MIDPNADDGAELVEPEQPAEQPSRDVLRSRRKREVRAKTESMSRLSKTKRSEREFERVLDLEEVAPEDLARPKTRADCIDAPRPCPYVSCSHHLYLDVSLDTGSVKFNFPDIEVDEMAESCALDVADESGATLERVGEVLNVTRERVRQVEVIALAKMRRFDEETADALASIAETDRKPVRKLPILREPARRAHADRLSLVVDDDDGDES